MNTDSIVEQIRRRRVAGPMLLLALALVTLTFALFSPALHYELVDLDDVIYITQNPIVLDGLSWSSVKLVFAAPYAGMYAPLLWISYMTDIECFGQSLWGLYSTNILLHSLNALLLFLLFFAWSRKPWRAFFFAALWAWHPLRVESVAWIAERKDVLSGFFFLLCIAAYYFAKRPAPIGSLPSEPSSPPLRNKILRFGGFLASLLFLALGLLVKPSLVPTPGLLLLLDFWPLRRFSLSPRSLLRSLPLLLLEKTPFFLLSAAAAFVSSQAHHSADAIADVSLFLCLKSIPIHFGFYLFKIFHPHNLSALYPDVLFTRPDFFIALILLIGLSYWVWLSRHQRPNELVGWLWFLGFLVPVIGLVRFGVQTVADRFTYLPAMGLSLALLFAFPSCQRPSLRRIFPPLRAALAVLLLGTLALLSSRYLPVWKNPTSLFGNVLRVSPYNYMALCQQAKRCIEKTGDFNAAEKFADEAALSNPSGLLSIQTKALCLSQLDGPEAARKYLHSHVPTGLRSTPGYWEWTLAMYALSVKEYDEALALADQALELMPVFDSTRNSVYLLAMTAAYEKGDQPLALSYARQFPPYRLKTELAFSDLMPFYVTLWVGSQRRETLAYFHRLIAADPDSFDVLNNIAWGLATANWSPATSSEVLDLAKRVRDLSPSPNPGIFDTLAAAYANAGDFPAAVRNAQYALVLLSPPFPQDTNLYHKVESRLQKYQTNEPYREDAFYRLWRAMQ